MNPKSRLWIIHDKTTILMNTTFAKMEKNNEKALSQYGSCGRRDNAFSFVLLIDSMIADKERLGDGAPCLTAYSVLFQAFSWY